VLGGLDIAWEVKGREGVGNCETFVEKLRLCF